MKASPLLAVVGLGLAAACDSPDPQPLGYFPVASVAVGSRVAFVDQATATAFVIDPAERQLRPHLHPVGENPRRALARPGHDELLVLSAGVRDDGNRPAEPPTLAVVPTEPGKSPRRHVLDSHFTELALSPDGRFAVLHFLPDYTPDGGSLLVNPNEIAVLDLDAAAGAGPAPSRALRSFGAVPRQVVFSPPLSLHADGGPRMLRLAVVLSDNYITLVDLENDRTEITVSLTRSDEPRLVRPVQVLFEPGDATSDPTVFVRSDGSTDIVALRLVASPPPRPDRSNDFRPVLSLLGSGSRPADLALYQASEGLRLLMVAPDASEASVIDPRTSRVTTFPLGARAEQIVLYEGASPAEPERRPRALLLAAGGGQVGFLDLDRLEELRGRNLELRPMSRPVERFVPLVERGVVLASHGLQRTSGAGLSIIDLDRRTVSPLVTESMQDLQPGPAPTDEIWLVPTSDSRLARLAISHLTATEVRLDLPATRVLPLARSAGGARFVVVEHGPGGTITVLDAEKPERQTARSLVGFMYTNLLERRKP